jgi:NAD(P)-dependent dehydrogenase (short-subunit alcohol dehydrogenase family)
MDLKLAGKVALVTGASVGLGRAIAQTLAEVGCRLAIVARREDRLRNAADEIAASGRERPLVIVADITQHDAAPRIRDEVLAAFGRLDVLVNNAGEQHSDKDIGDITEEQLRRTFQTNIFGMFYLTQAAAPHLKEGSAIINCTSETMYSGSSHLLDYSATKGAITAFTRSLALNLVEKGIRVNAVAPGPIWTPLNPFGGQEPEKIPEFGKKTPMGRPGQPNEVAPSFLFLACEDSSYMTAQVLHPDGGDTTSS